jgi:tRNA 2-thiouridine synthesizing protein A
MDNADSCLDTRGLKCPLPLLKLKKTIALMAPGKVIRIYATDMGSKRDFHDFCKKTGHNLLEANEVLERDDGGNLVKVFIFLIQKSEIN